MTSDVPFIPRESVALDRVSKIPNVSQLKSILQESDSLEKDRKIVLEGLQESHFRSHQKENLSKDDLNDTRKILQKSSIPQIPVIFLKVSLIIDS